jgi:hypothetical protein
MFCPLRHDVNNNNYPCSTDCAWWEPGSKTCFVGNGMNVCSLHNAIGGICREISKLTEEVIKLTEAI